MEGGYLISRKGQVLAHEIFNTTTTFSQGGDLW